MKSNQKRVSVILTGTKKEIYRAKITLRLFSNCMRAGMSVDETIGFLAKVVTTPIKLRKD